MKKILKAWFMETKDGRGLWEVAALQANKALALAPFVTVDPYSENGVRGQHITFSGANIHIVSRSATTNDNVGPTGLGNVIIGYDEITRLRLCRAVGDRTTL